MDSDSSDGLVSSGELLISMLSSDENSQQLGRDMFNETIDDSFLDAANASLMKTELDRELELPLDMRFNEGHVVSIVTYSVLMAISGVGNMTVLIRFVTLYVLYFRTNFVKCF
jgi:hypothetical protein